MKNLIPKSINKSKFTIWRNVSLIDILIVFTDIALSGMFGFGLPLLNWQKIIAIFLLSLLAIPLVIQAKSGVKGWYALFLLLKHLSISKKYQKGSRNDTSLLVPYDKAIGEFFIQTHKIRGKSNLVGCLTLRGFDISLLNADEQILRLKDLQEALKFSNFPITFLKLEEPLNFKETADFYEKQLKKLINLYKSEQISKDAFISRKSQLKGLISNLQKELVITEEGIKTKKCFYIFVYGKNVTDLEEKMLTLENKLTNSNLLCERLNNYEIVKTLKLIWNPYAEPLSKKEFESHKNNLGNLLLFDTFRLHKTHFTADNIHYAVNGIRDYPLLINDLWGATLACNEQTVIWNINSLNHTQMKLALNKAINNAYTKQFMTKSHINRSENNYEIESYQQLIEDINGNNEIIKNVNILFLNYGTTYKSLKASQMLLKKSLGELEIKIDYLVYRQLEGYNAFLPKNFDPLMMKIGREIPCATLAASFPFMTGGLNDKQGMYLGNSNIGDTIFFDPFKLDNRRINHNQIIIGTTGAGKSFTTKKMISFHLNMGRTVIVIDPEREYKKLCRYYAGQWIDTGDASFGKINPLQILDNNFKDTTEFQQKSNNKIEEAMDEQNSAPVSNHLRLIAQWFKTLYKDFNDREFNLLIRYLKLLYQQWNISNETNVNALTNDKFPTMTDLYELLWKEYEITPNVLLKEFIDVIATDFLKDGRYEQLWNGHTTLKFANSFVVYDVLTLFDQDEPRVTAAQLHLVLAFIKLEVKNNRFKTKNEIVIVVDEAHLAIDKDNPVALNFMYQMVKRIRKYNGSIIITTQNLNDFTGTEEIRKKTTAMINNTQYSLILKLKPKDLEDVANLYNSYGGLTTTELDYIARAKQGQALFIVSGYERHCINIYSEENQQEIF